MKYNSTFLALSPNGRKKWGYAVTGRSFNPVVAPDGTIYLTSHDFYNARETNLHALTSAGSLKWKKPLTYLPMALTLRPDGSLILYAKPIGPGGLIDSVIALDSTGNQLWKWDTSSPIHDRPAFGYDGTIYVSLGADPQYRPGSVAGLQALTPEGASKWFVETTDEMRPCGPSVGADGTVYFGTTYLGENYSTPPLGSLWAVSSVGTVNWKHELPGHARYHPAIASDGTVIIGSAKSSPFPGTQNCLCAVNPDGTRRWNYGLGTLNSPATTPAIDVDGNVYVCFSANGDSWLDVLSSAGNFKWTGSLGGGVVSYAHTVDIGEDGTIYVSADYVDKLGPVLYAFGPGTP
ncbi:MAG: PQQ-binding-like beta-propeller repeat protein, partial [bacterium]|nr:PQQ-binding-like beta-propeller repeat protein [bacterium]